MQTVSSDASVSHGLETTLVDLALQGGGSHGAFTWGVLDRLLEETWLRIDGISGTSAGAMNAVVLVDGFEKGGSKGAQAALEDFWRRVAYSARFSPIRRSPLDILAMAVVPMLPRARSLTIRSFESERRPRANSTPRRSATAVTVTQWCQLAWLCCRSPLS
jgi:predicted acylesterase/phospholipase RssA